MVASILLTYFKSTRWAALGLYVDGSLGTVAGCKPTVTFKFNHFRCFSEKSKSLPTKLDINYTIIKQSGMVCPFKPPMPFTD